MIRVLFAVAHGDRNNVTPADMYYGRYIEIQSRREQIKEKTMRERRRLNRLQRATMLS